jgi:ATP-dependent DNA helicase RecQ
MGHDFRPAYLKYGTTQSSFSCHLFLAPRDCNIKSEEDIISELKLEKPQLLKIICSKKHRSHGFEVEDKLQNSSNFKKNPQSSIIYVRNRKAC